MGDDTSLRAAPDDDDDEQGFAQEEASAHDLCLALRWHRASILETLPAVDDDGDMQRMAEVRQVISRLENACEALVTYYKLPWTDATEDNLAPQGEPPRLIDARTHSALLEGLQSVPVCDPDDAPQGTHLRLPGLMARLLRRGR